jgi:hypothetical protein
MSSVYTVFSQMWKTKSSTYTFRQAVDKVCWVNSGIWSPDVNMPIISVTTKYLMYFKYKLAVILFFPRPIFLNKTLVFVFMFVHWSVVNLHKRNSVGLNTGGGWSNGSARSTSGGKPESTILHYYYTVVLYDVIKIDLKTNASGLKICCSWMKESVSKLIGSLCWLHGCVMWCHN